MPRTIITTTFTGRTKPTTTLTSIRWDKIGYLLLETWFKLLLEDWGWILLEDSINNVFSTPRYAKYLEDLIWNNVFDLTWNTVTWISGSNVNKLDTFWA